MTLGPGSRDANSRNLRIRDNSTTALDRELVMVSWTRYHATSLQRATAYSAVIDRSVFTFAQRTRWSVALLIGKPAELSYLVRDGLFFLAIKKKQARLPTGERSTVPSSNVREGEETCVSPSIAKINARDSRREGGTNSDYIVYRRNQLLSGGPLRSVLQTIPPPRVARMKSVIGSFPFCRVAQVTCCQTRTHLRVITPGETVRARSMINCCCCCCCCSAERSAK